MIDLQGYFILCVSLFHAFLRFLPFFLTHKRYTMTHSIIVGFQPDSNRIFPVEGTFNPTDDFYHLTPDLTHNFALPSAGSSILKQDSNFLICFFKKKLQLLIYHFFSLFHSIIKNNTVAFLWHHYSLAMAYSLRSNFITFKSVAL